MRGTMGDSDISAYAEEDVDPDSDIKDGLLQVEVPPVPPLPEIVCRSGPTQRQVSQESTFCTVHGHEDLTKSHLLTCTLPCRFAIWCCPQASRGMIPSLSPS